MRYLSQYFKKQRGPRPRFVFSPADEGRGSLAFSDRMGFGKLDGEHFINFILWPKTKK